jgi:antitoxin HigA-1
MATWKNPVHPGKILTAELKETGLSVIQLAKHLQVPDNRLYAILHGKRAVTGDTALRLGRFFENGPDYWISLQKAYELAKAYEEDKKKEKTGKGIRKITPYSQIEKPEIEQKKMKF